MAPKIVVLAFAFQFKEYHAMFYLRICMLNINCIGRPFWKVILFSFEFTRWVNTWIKYRRVGSNVRPVQKEIASKLYLLSQLAEVWPKGLKQRRLPQTYSILFNIFTITFAHFSRLLWVDIEGPLGYKRVLIKIFH